MKKLLNLIFMFIFLYFLFSYLFTGHTQSVGDTVHSVIEKASRKRTIFTQDEWATIIENAKVTEPKYTVHQITQNEIFDFSTESNSTFWKNLKVSQISSITVYPNQKIKCCYDYAEESIEITKVPKVKFALRKCYKKKLSVSVEKKKIWVPCAMMV